MMLIGLLLVVGASGAAYSARMTVVRATRLERSRIAAQHGPRQP
ncbi:MAG: hypothetical protein JWL95_2820 [Gemmatimonadetes bacterium]|nr:hypothetical protein [Gemmatimonadota bacterium]